ncbi:alpha/beta hydrolase [Vampirovibrio sp.]|uniref:alpha/beta hydrolase n=1 Tax=Vampirovibrio sp. TaxID=2717857 RepID=UPI0035942283
MIQLNNDPFYFQPEQGAQEAFLFLHGLGGGVYEMRPLAEALLKQGYAVSGFNYPGHDQPSHRMPASTWQQWYEKVQEHYQTLLASHQKVSVIGFSTGCMLGLHLAADYAATSPVHRLILLSPFLKVRMEWYYLLQPERYVRSLSTIIRQIPRWRLPISDPQMHALALKASFFKTFNIPSVRSALELIKLVDGELETVNSPTLIIQSTADRVVCATGAKILMERLACPHNEVLWLEKSDHVLLLDNERETVIDKVVSFVNGKASAMGLPSQP